MIFLGSFKWRQEQLHGSGLNRRFCRRSQRVWSGIESLQESDRSWRISGLSLAGENTIFAPSFKEGLPLKSEKKSDTWKNCCNYPKIWTMWFYHRVMSPKDADTMANSVDPDETAPERTLSDCSFSVSTLFAQTYLSGNLGSLRQFLQSCIS